VFQAEHAPPATLEYLNWSEQPIGFYQSDHPPKIPRLGHHALVLEAQIRGFTSKKVFTDGGSSINLIYADTLQKIKIPLTDLLPLETSFHGIVPGKPTYPLGVIIWMSSSVPLQTSGRRRWNLRSSIGPLNITPPGPASIRLIHGGPPLRIPQAADARQ
jgi:hypothetical protein